MHVRGCYLHMGMQELLPIEGYEIDRGYFGRACVARRRRYSTMTARNACGKILRRDGSNFALVKIATLTSQSYARKKIVIEYTFIRPHSTMLTRFKVVNELMKQQIKIRYIMYFWRKLMAGEKYQIKRPFHSSSLTMLVMAVKILQ